MDEKIVHILAVEDDAFQRLALMDILSMLDYEVDTASDAYEAWEKLNEENMDFDLVLLDLELPGMDGLELLGKMKESSHLKDLPVIMVSAHNEMEKIYASLDLGALDFLIKPIRPGAVRGVVNQIKFRPKGATGTETGLNAYERVSNLGKGAYATVDLVRRKADGELRALKKIDLEFLNEKERRNAENEAMLMKVLVGPTIIQFYEQIVQGNNLYIIMEFADKGTLADKLQELRNKGDKLDTQTIVAWISHIIMALMIMHSKHVLHRDLKTQNLFITGNNTIKVGDLGIAKSLNSSMEMAQSVAGTPYNMAPEIIKGEKYGQKTDIWSLGCVLYEMVTFKRPFEGVKIESLFEAIINRDYNPISNSVDSNIRLMISQMLLKDPAKRPTVWDLANSPFIRDYITNFLEENNCTDIIMPLFDHDPRYKGKNKTSVKSNTIHVSELANLARSEIPLQEKKIGWFGKTYKGVFEGKALLQYLKDKYKHQAETAKNTCQEMLEQGLIHPVSNSTGFDSEGYYQFREDRTDIARNMVFLWNKNVRMAQAVTRDLVSMTNEMIATYREDLKAMKNSREFREVAKALAEIQRIEIKALTRLEKIEFFVNIYQIMALHQMIELQDSKNGWFWNPSDSFYYCISGMDYTLYQLKHGVLRGNKKPPGSFTRVFSNSDSRNLLPNFTDPRVLILCQDPPFKVQEIISFADNVEEILDEKTEEFCNREVCLNLAIEELVLPNLFYKYQRDFGNNEEDMIKWIWKYYTACKLSADDVVSLLKRQKLYIQYRDWE